MPPCRYRHRHQHCRHWLQVAEAAGGLHRRAAEAAVDHPQAAAVAAGRRVLQGMEEDHRLVLAAEAGQRVLQGVEALSRQEQLAAAAEEDRHHQALAVEQLEQLAEVEEGQQEPAAEVDLERPALVAEAEDRRAGPSR